MMWRILYHPIAELPRLAWVACAESEKKILSVFHGAAVECREEWMVEGVWDDAFDSGNFHRSENFFGSGIRIEGDNIYFVPSSALVDRLFFCSERNKILVSNSLVLLLAFTNARLKLDYNYRAEFFSILNGMNKYIKEFPVIHFDIKKFYQVYYSNIVFSDREIKYELRGNLKQIESFKQYYETIIEVLFRIKSNYESQRRKVPFSAFTALSSGYDSTAVSCLVKNIGVKTCFSCKRSNSSIPSWISKASAIDNGQPIADKLNLSILPLDPDLTNISEDELYFYASSYNSTEFIFHSMATYIEKMCTAAVVFTGYHGDKVWDVNTRGKYLNDQLIRGDLSGLSLSEVRLKSGFINVAVPFILARNIESIVKISRSAEMAPWRLNNSYDRPIPRRIAESAGVARQLFGLRKKAIVTHRYYHPINLHLRKQFFEFVKRNYNITQSYVYLHAIFIEITHPIIRTLTYIRYFKRLRAFAIPLNPDQDIKSKKKRSVIRGDANLCYLIFLWSVHFLSERTAKILHKYIDSSTHN